MTPPELSRLIESLRAKSSANYHLACWLAAIALVGACVPAGYVLLRYQSLTETHVYAALGIVAVALLSLVTSAVLALASTRQVRRLLKLDEERKRVAKDLAGVVREGGSR